MRAARAWTTGWLLGAALAVTAVDASAFCRTMTCPGGDCKPEPGTKCPTAGVPLKWSKLPLVFRFHGRPADLLPEDARAAIRAAFHRWSDAVCPPDYQRTSLRFAEGEDIASEKPLLPNGQKPDGTKVQAAEPFGIFFRDTGWPYDQNPDGTLAQTNHVFGVQSGLITYADIEINTGRTGIQHMTTGDNDMTGADLQAVITHEAGHYIGLAHSTVPTSIMVDSYCGGQGRCSRGLVTARRLSNDDIAAVCDLYPPNLVLTPDSNPQTRSCNTTAGPSLPSYATFAIGFAALAVLRLVRRRGARSAGDPLSDEG